MRRYSFDVLTEPWIPAAGADGTITELGLLPCLEHAHELVEIKDPSPIVEFGLYRLLVAFVLDALIWAGRRPRDRYGLEDLLDQGAFDGELFREYVRACGDVFDLFHPERPFLQTPMEERDKLEALAQLYPVVPSGTNVTHWYHYGGSAWEVSPAEAGRLLTTIAPFMTAGGRGKRPSINGAPAVYVLPVGHNLYQTLVLNLPLRCEQDTSDGMAAWRSERLPGSERTGATAVEALTWRPRRIQLLPRIEEDAQEGSVVRVGSMRFAQGDRTSTRFSWIDPNLAYEYGASGARPVRMRKNRSLWRDAGPLFFLDDLQHGRNESKVLFKRPDVIESAFALGRDDLPVRVQLYAMRTDMKMKVFEWHKAVWRVPPALGRSTRLGAVVFKELERAERCAWALRAAIRRLARRDGERGPSGLGAVADRCERAYWQALESKFALLLKSVADLGPDGPDSPEAVAEATAEWRETIRTSASEQFEFAAKDMDTSGDALQQVVRARVRLMADLRRALS